MTERNSPLDAHLALRISSQLYRDIEALQGDAHASLGYRVPLADIVRALLEEAVMHRRLSAERAAKSL
jgi:hypothetical protein